MIGKKELVQKLSESMDSKQAASTVDILLDHIQEELLAGNKVKLKGICTLVPEVKPQSKKVVAGVERKIPRRLRIRVITSEVLSGKWRKRYFPEVQTLTSESMRKFASGLFRA